MHAARGERGSQEAIALAGRPLLDYLVGVSAPRHAPEIRLVTWPGGPRSTRSGPRSCRDRREPRERRPLAALEVAGCDARTSSVRLPRHACGSRARAATLVRAARPRRRALAGLFRTSEPERYDSRRARGAPRHVGRVERVECRSIELRRDLTCGRAPARPGRSVRSRSSGSRELHGAARRSRRATALGRWTTGSRSARRVEVRSTCRSTHLRDCSLEERRLALADADAHRRERRSGRRGGAARAGA